MVLGATCNVSFGINYVTSSTLDFIVAQRSWSCGCPIIGSVQSQVEWDFDQLEGVPACDRGLGTRWPLKFFPIHSMIHPQNSKQDFQIMIITC